MQFTKVVLDEKKNIFKRLNHTKKEPECQQKDYIRDTDSISIKWSVHWQFMYMIYFCPLCEMITS